MQGQRLPILHGLATPAQASSLGLSALSISFLLPSLFPLQINGHKVPCSSPTPLG